MDHSTYYPCASDDALKAKFVGRSIADLDTPAVIVDRALVTKNCNAMLETIDVLGYSFRAHVKTHKTAQVTALQIPSPRPLRLVTSTVAEIEELLPTMLEAAKIGRAVDVLYGVPFNKTTLQRIGKLNTQLLDNEAFKKVEGVAPISVLLDSEQHVELLSAMPLTATGKLTGVFIKIDSGYHRAGVSVTSKVLEKIIKAIEAQHGSTIWLRGLYTHLGHSYSFSTPAESLEGLSTETNTLLKAAVTVRKTIKAPLLLSVGATPTATAAENFLTPQFNEARKKLEQVRKAGAEKKLEIELHAGVYPFLDLQQVATGARPAASQDKSKNSSPAPGSLSVHDIALRVLVEVSSVYTDREQPEVLVAAGTMALGREPCKSYPGWGIVSPWSATAAAATRAEEAEGEFYDPAGKQQGWIVRRIAQEHGILNYECSSIKHALFDKKRPKDFKIGDKLLIWPNHACIASAAHGWYYVVDSNLDDANIVRDIWVRWRGW